MKPWFMIFLLIPAAAHAGFNPVKKDNIIFWPDLKQGEGTGIRDFSQTGASMTVQGNATWVYRDGDFGKPVSYSTSTWAPMSEGAIYIPEVSSNFLETAPRTSPWDFQGNPFSILIKFTKEKRGTNVSLLNNTNNCGGEGFSLGVTAPDIMHFTICGVAQHNWTTQPDFSRGTMILMTRNSGGTINLYLNGNLDRTITGTSNLQALSTPRRLVVCGTNVSGTSACLGMVSEIVMWNVELNSTDALMMWESQFDNQAMVDQ